MTNIEKYQKELDKVKANTELDETTKLIYVDALERKVKDEERSEKAGRGRASQALFVAHFKDGCPECQHTFRPTAEAIDALLDFRATSNMKI